MFRAVGGRKLGSPGVCNSNSLYPNQFGYFNNPCFFEEFPCKGFGGIDTAMRGGEWKNMFSPLGSPEHISPITACFDGNGFSGSVPFDGGPAFTGGNLQYTSEPSLGNYVHQQLVDQGEMNMINYGGFIENNHNAYDIPSLWGKEVVSPYSNLWIPQQNPQCVPDASDILPNMIFNTPRSTYEDSLQSQLHWPGVQQFDQWHHQPSVQFDEQPQAQSSWFSVEQDECFNKIAGNKSSKLPQLPSEQLHGVQHVASESSVLGFGSPEAAEVTDSSSLTIHRILLSYINYKSMPVNMGGSLDSFLNYMHLTECNDHHECNCGQYLVLLCHFDNCNYYSCNICGPIRRLRATDEAHSESGKRKNDLSGAFCDRDFNGTITDISFDISPTLKRLKTENTIWLANRVSHGATPSMNRPCAPGRLPHLEQWPEDSVFSADEMKFYKELLSPTEDPTSLCVTTAGVIDNSPIFDLINAPVFSEELKQILRMENPSLLANRVSEVVPSLNKSCAPQCLPQLAQWPEAPVFNANAMEFYKEKLSPTEDPTSSRIARVDVIDNSPILDLNDSPVFSKELTNSCMTEIRSDVKDIFQGLNSDGVPGFIEEPNHGHKEQEIQVGSKLDQANYDTEKKSAGPTTQGVSLVDFFTAAQMKEHLYSFRQPIGQEVIGNTTHSAVENICQLCAMDKLVFAPTPIYCSSCSVRIKCNLVYYWSLVEGTQYCFCTSCFKGIRGCKISFRGVSISKAKLQKEKNNEENEESWVQCDKCELWQHQICALYNDKRDSEGKAEYICPKCCLEEIETGERVPLPKAAAFGAKDLPSTMLSDHIEQRLFRRLKQEREERANALGKKLDEVPGAVDLVVRVVLSVEKQLKVKKQFLDIFHSQNYQAELPYKSKVILLFQKIEGVDVCLFGMYVQEFGSECGHPNQRCVYISFLDSVKYFRPETETVTGEALRTFVYHEILIGYLDYCKKRGFVSCYLWACPPVKGEEYILYCHPETQKTPKPDKLRSWYKSMLRKAAKDNVVVDYTNLYDHFFVSTGECNTKITTARLPYFDGDYWSAAAENISRNIELQSGGVQKKVNKLVTKRTFKAMGYITPSSNAAKDILVMQKLGNTIFPVKEDFIIVHLQFTCMRCHEAILSGRRWFCNQCKNIQLCSRCLDVNRDLHKKKTHTSKSGEKHLLSKVVVNDLPRDTEDKDAVLYNEFFENKDTFLGFCQSNHYQFDTLRRAKHSSMMILYHLHKLIAPNNGQFAGTMLDLEER